MERVRHDVEDHLAEGVAAFERRYHRRDSDHVGPSTDRLDDNGPVVIRDTARASSVTSRSVGGSGDGEKFMRNREATAAGHLVVPGEPVSQTMVQVRSGRWSSQASRSEPLGDAPPDLGSLVLLQEVPGVRDQVGLRRLIAAAKRRPVSGVRIGSWSAHSISEGRVVGRERVEHAAAVGGAGRVRLERDQQRERARPGLRSRVGNGAS